MALIPAGRKIAFMGLNAPYDTRGFNPDAFAQRVQVLLGPLAPHLVLDPDVRVNPYAELWVQDTIARRNRCHIMAVMALLGDGTVSIERLASLLAQAVRDAGAGSNIVAEALALKMLQCEDIGDTFTWDSEFAGCCLTVNTPGENTPFNTPSVPLTIPADRGSLDLRARTTVVQGERAPAVPPPIQPGSVTPRPVATQAPAVTGTPAYGGGTDNPQIPGNTPRQDAAVTPTWKYVLGGVAAALGLAAVGLLLTSAPSRPAPLPVRPPLELEPAPARTPARPRRRGR